MKYMNRNHKKLKGQKNRDIHLVIDNSPLYFWLLNKLNSKIMELQITQRSLTSI